MATANATAAVRARAIGGVRSRGSGSCRASARVTAARSASRAQTAARWTSRRPVSRAEAIVDRSAAAAEEAAAAASPTSRRALGFENDGDRVKSALETNVAGADAERPEEVPVSLLAQEVGLGVDVSAGRAAAGPNGGGKMSKIGKMSFRVAGAGGLLERDRDEVWRKAEGHMVDVAAGFDDLWALDANKNAKYTHISALNESGSGWTSPSVPGGTARTLDVGLEEAYFMATTGAYYAKPADGSGSWNRLPGLLRQAGVGKSWMWGVVQDGQWVWACELPCVGTGVHHDLPGTVRACEVGLDYVFCVNEDNELYRNDAEVDWIDPATNTRWSYPNHLPSIDVWTRIPIAAKQVTVGEEYVWIIDTSDKIQFCALPCDDNNWKQPFGVPEGIIYIDASKFKD